MKNCKPAKQHEAIWAILTFSYSSTQASKEAILAQLPQAECIHFATHICWKTPAIVLSPGEVVSKKKISQVPSAA